MLRIIETLLISLPTDLLAVHESINQVRILEANSPHHVTFLEAYSLYDADTFDDNKPCWMPKAVWMIFQTQKGV